ncbi:MAG: mitochondrial fission ELM1 family protein [Magnetovibrionaceae bacterium]
MAARPRTPLIWTLADDRAGNVAQARGVSEALGLPWVEKEIRYSALAGLPNGLRGAGLLGLASASKANLNDGNWPDLVIGAGRRTAPVSRWIKRQSKGAAFLCQIMHPGSAGRGEFDLIAYPAHDGRMPQANEMVITGAPNRVTGSFLSAAGAEWMEAFKDLPKPWIAVIVGGSTKRRDFTPAMARDLGRQASILARKAGGSLMITTSRRSGAKQTSALMTEVTVPHHAYLWGSDGPNPYYGYLALADAVMVTGDSVSMVSECCATPKPVYIFAPKDLTSAKHARLHQSLYDGGYARPLESSLEDWTHEPLNAAAEVAQAIKDRLRL